MQKTKLEEQLKGAHSKSQKTIEDLELQRVGLETKLKKSHQQAESEKMLQLKHTQDFQKIKDELEKERSDHKICQNEREKEKIEKMKLEQELKETRARLREMSDDLQRKLSELDSNCKKTGLDVENEKKLSDLAHVQECKQLTDRLKHLESELDKANQLLYDEKHKQQQLEFDLEKANESLKSEQVSHDQVNLKCSELSDEVEGTKDQLACLKKIVELKDKQIEGLNARISLSDEENENLKTERNHFIGKINTFKLEVATKTEEIQALNVARIENKQAINAGANTLETERKNLREANGVNEKLQLEISELNQRISRLEGQLAEAKGRANQAVKAEQNARENARKHHDDTLQGVVKVYLEQIGVQNDEVTRLRQRLRDREHSFFPHGISRQEFNTLQNEKDQLLVQAWWWHAV